MMPGPRTADNEVEAQAHGVGIEVVGPSAYIFNKTERSAAVAGEGKVFGQVVGKVGEGFATKICHCIGIVKVYARMHRR